jgi:hypothetical protein
MTGLHELSDEVFLQSKSMGQWLLGFAVGREFANVERSDVCLA